MLLELKGGTKKVSWTLVKEMNEWYINEDFLLPGKTFIDPSRIAEADLHAYWAHLYKLSEAGQSFTFKATKPPKIGEKVAPMEDHRHEEENRPEEDHGPEDEDQPEEESQPKKGKSKKGKSKKGKSKKASAPEEEGNGSGRKMREGVPEESEENPELPSQCLSDEKKLPFLRSLCPDEEDYQAVVSLVAQMRVSSQYSVHISS